MEIDVLIINTLVYICTFIYVFTRTRKLTLYVFIWAAYSLITLMGYVCVVTENHYSHDVNLGYKIDIIPYIFAYLTVLLLSRPFAKIRRIELDINLFHKKAFILLLRIVGLIFILLAIIDMINAYIVSSIVGLGEAYSMAHNGEEINIIQSPFITTLIRWSRIISLSFGPIYVVYYINNIYQRPSRLFRYLFFASFAFLPGILSSIAGGSKGGLFFSLTSILFYYILFYPQFPLTIKRKINFIGTVVSLFFIIYVVSITFSRIDSSAGNADSNEVQLSLVHYLGESYPNLGYFYYNQVKRHPNGRRFFPEFFDNNPEKEYGSLGLEGKFDYWNSITGVRMNLFKTFWGDWYIEFGLIGSIVGILILYFFFIFCCFRFVKYRICFLPMICFYYNYIIIRGMFTGNGLEGSLLHKSFYMCVCLSFMMLYYMKHGGKIIKAQK